MDEDVQDRRLNSLVEDDAHNLDRMRSLPHFVLLRLFDNLYSLALSLLPATSPLLVSRAMALCYKSLLTAGITIGRLHPDDAGPITRRAVEIAILVLATRYDGRNLQAWWSSDRRLERWDRRLAGERPRSFTPELILPRDHQELQALKRHLGVYSDISAHFTPEFEAHQAWRETPGVEGLVTVDLGLQTTNMRHIEREFIMLADVHDRILRVLDESCNGALMRDARWASLLARAGDTNAELARLYVITWNLTTRTRFDGPTR